MRHKLLSTLATLLAAGASHAELDAAGAARLDALRHAPDQAGALVYRGAVFAKTGPGGEPLFRYERRVIATAQGLLASHITHDAAGEVIIVEQADVTPTYALRRFEAVNRQLGYSGSATLSLDGQRLDYRLDRQGKLTTASEAVRTPVVSGPSLHGFVLQHWNELAAGRSLPVRMVVLAEKTSYGFQIRRLAEADGVTSFAVTPNHLAVRLMLAPLVIRFDSATRHVLRYEGRVPPMRVAGTSLKAFDARVDYAMSAATYR